MNPLPDLHALSLEALVAQMMVVRASGYLFDHQIQYPHWEPPAAQLHHWLHNLGVGGVILVGGSAGELALRCQQLQEWASIPLLIAADIEEGVGQRFGGATEFPPPMALGAIARQDRDQAQRYAEAMGAITAQEALAIGLNWILAPVVDVNNNPQNPVINVRAFGETPDEVSHLIRAFIQGTQAYPVLTTAKHFPGHGDTAVDSHLDLPILLHSQERLHQVEFPPFKAAIAAGVDGIMTAHLLVQTLDAHYPATLSRRILTELLRQGWGFQGLIVTDALIMGAIANHYGADEACVLAVDAGADILLMPVNPETAIPAVCAAVRDGRLSQAQIVASVERIWAVKQKVMGTPSPSPSPSLPLLTQLAQPSARTTVTEILQASLQVGGSLPLKREPPQSRRQLRNLILVDDLLNCEVLSRHAPAVVLPRKQGYELVWVDQHTPPIPEDVAHPLGTQPTLLQLFIRGNPFRGTEKLTQMGENWLKKLLRSKDLQALVVYGSPYVLEPLVADLPADIPYVFTYGQIPEAQAIALQHLFSQAEPLTSSREFI